MADNIKITTDKNGRKLAYRWSMRTMRWIRMSLAEAEMLIATEYAARIDDDGTITTVGCM